MSIGALVSIKVLSVSEIASYLRRGFPRGEGVFKKSNTIFDWKVCQGENLANVNCDLSSAVICTVYVHLCQSVIIIESVAFSVHDVIPQKLDISDDYSSDTIALALEIQRYGGESKIQLQ